MAEDKARNRVESSDSARERNAVFRPQGPAVARMGFFNGLLPAIPAAGVDTGRIAGHVGRFVAALEVPVAGVGIGK